MEGALQAREPNIKCDRFKGLVLGFKVTGDARFLTFEALTPSIVCPPLLTMLLETWILLSVEFAGSREKFKLTLATATKRTVAVTSM